jgi:MerR family transcriptional regulator/heat shock protein HspR
MKKRPVIRKNVKSVEIRAEDPVYTIGVVSRLLGVPEWTLRSLEKEGLVRPKRVSKDRYYSMKEIRRIEYIHFLMDEKGVNLRGIKFIMETRSFSVE